MVKVASTSAEKAPFMIVLLVLKRTVYVGCKKRGSSLGAGVLGDCLGSLADCVLGQFPGQEKPDGRLYLAARDGGSLVVVSEAAGLCCDALENVIHEAVHDAHGLRGYTGVWVNLLQNFVDVDCIAFLPLSLLLLVSL